MQIRVLNESDRQKWDDFVSSQKEPQILQSFEWGQFKAKSGWEHFVVAIEQNGEIKAGISILSRKLPIFNKTLFYAPRGPIADANLIDPLIDGVCVEAALKNAIALKIDPEVEGSNQSLINILKDRGFIQRKKQIQPRTTYFVDLNKDADSLLMGFEEKTRYNIRLAEKKCVKVYEDSTISGVEIFYKMYQETCKRDTFMIHPKSYYLKLKEYLIDRGMANIFIAKFREIPIASVFIFRFGSRVWYMYGASLNEYRNVMPNYALHWHVIKWAKEKGYKLYDLWGIPSNPKEGHPLYGVYRFKKGFNGELRSWVGVYDLPFDKIAYHLFDKGMAFYQALRSLITKGKISDSLSE
jgi:lipid II:glycine glycyltransferase (peptidoglycan interpeptide bridge formation enzyme)